MEAQNAETCFGDQSSAPRAASVPRRVVARRVPHPSSSAPSIHRVMPSRTISLLLVAVTYFFSAASAIRSPPALSSPLFAVTSSNRLLVLRGGETATDTPEVDTTLDTASPIMAASSSSALSLVGSVIDKIDSSLVAGPHVQGIAAVYAISFASVAAFTMIRTSYAFTIGYGGAVAIISIALMSSFKVPIIFSEKISPSGHLVNASLLYGIRLASYLAFRNLTVPSKAKAMKEMDKTPRAKRLILAFNVSMLYAFMMTPVLYALRGKEGLVSGSLEKCQLAGVVMTYLGLAIETISDAHKYIVKRSNNSEYGSTKFVGPTTGTFLLCRHPSYFGEVLFWFGLFVGGIATFGKTAAAWICSSLGLLGITFVMTSASKRLDQKQLENYGGQDNYDTYRSKVRGRIFPLVD